jgi:uncharacterized protein
MAALTHDVDLARLRLYSGEARRLVLDVGIEPFALGGQTYAVAPARVPVALDVSRMVGHGYALRLRFAAQLEGPCMRCLQTATPTIAVDAREVDQPGGGEELDSPYVTGDLLDLTAWARDALALAMPAQLVCREDCAGLCPICAANLNETGREHQHERAPDPRWDKLRELNLSPPS